MPDTFHVHTLYGWIPEDEQDVSYLPCYSADIWLAGDYSEADAITTAESIRKEENEYAQAYRFDGETIFPIND